MRNSPILTTPPPTAVDDAVELYAIALAQAETAASRYKGLATTLGNASSMEPVRCVFETLGEREQERIDEIRLRCEATAHKLPDASDLQWTPSDLVPTEELSDLADSALSTPYQAWAIAVRHRERAFVFWTYVAAQTASRHVQAASEQMAREALSDAGLLRRERRLAWRAELPADAEQRQNRGQDRLSSAALLESLLFKEVMRWSLTVPPAARDELFAAAGYSGAEVDGADLELPAAPPGDTLADVMQRAIRYAEQVTSLYLAEADHAADQARLDLAQKLAAPSITRLARLRRLVATQPN
jgi:hypothetical protein